MKNFVKLIGIIAFTAVIVFPTAAQTVEGGWSRYLHEMTKATLDYTVADDGLVTVTVGGTAMPQANNWYSNIGYWYTSKALKANTSYTYIFEAWTQSGTRDLDVFYYDNHDTGIFLGTSISITNQRKTYTITGFPLPPNGDKKFTFQCADKLGTFYVKILEIREARRGEELTAKDRWHKYVDPSSRATLDFSFSNDGVCAINIRGGTESPNEGWKASAQYRYIAKANTSYTYVLEMWTDSGTRQGMGYYSDEINKVYLYESNVTITNRRAKYTITGQPIPKDGVWNLRFDCANQLGTLYVKVLEIREATPSEAAQASWQKWVDSSSKATLDYSVARDGVVTVNVGGTVDTNWKANVQYQYSANANTRYTYVIEAWTQSGNRDVWAQYYGNNADQIYLGEMVKMTNKRTTYTIVGNPIPKSGSHPLSFSCADQLGRFYVKMLEIRETTPEDLARAQWDKYVANDSKTMLDYSIANDGVVTVTVGGSVSTNNKWNTQVRHHYKKKANTRYTYVFEAWTQRGNRDLEIGYYHNNDTGIGLVADLPITITNRRTTYTFTGQAIPREDMLTGIWFACADQLGIFYVKVLEIREATPSEIARADIQAPWRKYIEPDSRATLDYSVADDGVVTVTIGGRASKDRWGWTQIQHKYTAKANKSYTYVFEAWTESGTRDLWMGYYWDDDTQESLGAGVSITNRRTTYTITGEAIPKAGEQVISFACANQTGTFYLKVLEIREN